MSQQWVLETKAPNSKTYFADPFGDSTDDQYKAQKFDTYDEAIAFRTKYPAFKFYWPAYRTFEFKPDIESESNWKDRP